MLKWQVSHCAVGATCVAGFICAFSVRYCPLWQFEHCPAAFAGCTKLRSVHTTVLVWQVSHWRESGMCVGPCRSALANTYEPLWQVEHCPAVLVWFMKAGLKATKLVWQVSH